MKAKDSALRQQEVALSHSMRMGNQWVQHEYGSKSRISLVWQCLGALETW